LFWKYQHQTSVSCQSLSSTYFYFIRIERKRTVIVSLGEEPNYDDEDTELEEDQEKRTGEMRTMTTNQVFELLNRISGGYDRS
jgi:hypothetical protein